VNRTLDYKPEDLFSDVLIIWTFCYWDSKRGHKVFTACSICFKFAWPGKMVFTKMSYCCIYTDAVPFQQQEGAILIAYP
jgi:hypothetical protein